MGNCTSRELRVHKDLRHRKRRGSESLPLRFRLHALLQGLLQRGGVGLFLRAAVHREDRKRASRRAGARIHRRPHASRRRADGAGEPARARAFPQARARQVRAFEDDLGLHRVHSRDRAKVAVALVHGGDGRVPFAYRCACRRAFHRGPEGHLAPVPRQRQPAHPPPALIFWYNIPRLFDTGRCTAW